MTYRILAAVAALAFATAASAAERPLGASSEPTVYGHAVAEPYAPPIAEVDLRRETAEAAAARAVSAPSEPTVWGHRPNAAN